MFKASIATEINNEINQKKEEAKRRQKELETKRARFVGECGKLTAPMHNN